MVEAQQSTPSAAVKPGDHVFLVDGSSYIFRAYHALPPLTRRSDSLPVGAVSGFCNMLWKLLQEGDPSRQAVFPTHLAVIFDAKGKTFRNEIYEDYKANRPEPPEDLIPQFGLIRDAVRAFNVACVEQVGYEADDLIAAYVATARANGADVTIIGSDKDLMQLIGEGVAMVDTLNMKQRGTARRIERDQVIEKFGVPPEKVIDVQALAGDSVDNIPGVPGIGVKTAAQLIEEYGDLDTLLAQAAEIKQTKRRENLIEFAEQARVSRKLATLDQGAPLKIALDGLAVEPVDGAKAVAFLKAVEFTTLTKRVAESCGVEIEAIEPVTLDVVGWEKPEPVSLAEPGDGSDGTPQALAAERASEMAALPVKRDGYETVTTVEHLQAWIGEAVAQGYVAFDTETTSLDAMQADLVGVSLALVPGKACYVPLGHRAGDGLDLEGADLIVQIPLREALDLLKPLLEDRSVLKIGQNLKYDSQVLLNYGIRLNPIDDTMLMSYALDAGRGKHGMDDLAARHLGHTCISFKDVAGTGKSRVTFDLVPVGKASDYAAEDADVTLRLWHVLKPRLVAEGLTTVYETLERPLAPILADMEFAGIKVERQVLSRLSGDFAQSLARLEAEIHQLADGPFNIASPKQLGEILFDRMNLPGGKKTKTGAWGTGADILEDLSSNEELPGDARTFVRTILEWRQLAKLKSTYTDALPEFINPKTGRIHTSYAMAATTTGRLASTDPNLQNIPIRSPEGRQIRTAFIAEKGNQLISADYSQIELRVLAHIADIAALKQAFADGLDIHAMTASEMFGVPIKDMDPSVRRRAKAINFGIIYGISAFGLANQLGISRGEAADYIKTYFERFPGIKDYMEATKAEAHEAGFVRTVFGRKIHYPDINTKNPARRGFYERAAINAPIQGSAADIIRRAMIRMPKALSDAGLNARMLLQVHDELIFEAPKKQINKTIETAVGVMEKACAPVVSLNVPLKVDACAADNWEEAH
ncbi:DNA polymerase I [bacterium MnTg02]|nr:DNA polymerase I [bacterium MnTg02]